MTMTPEQLRGEATAIDRMHGETLTVEWRLRMAERLRAHATALEELVILRNSDVGMLRAQMYEDLKKLDAALEELAAKNAALDFAEGAIEDAIYTDDGLEGDTGQRVIHIIQEARDRGTFDREKFGPPIETRLELTARAKRAEAALADAERKCERGCFCLMEMMQAYERRVRSLCAPEEIEKRPWECAEYNKAAEYLRAVWKPDAYRAEFKEDKP